MTVSMQFLVNEVERVRLYNHNQTVFIVDIKETLGKGQLVTTETSSRHLLSKLGSISKIT